MDKALARVWLRPQEGDIQVMIFDALTSSGKRLFIGEGIGEYNDDGTLSVTEVCDLVFQRLMALTKRVHILEIADKSRIEQRLQAILEFAQPHSGVMVLCSNSEVVDGLLPFLPMQKPATFPAIMTRH